MSEINVISRTQRIIVEPASRSVAVINAGPGGPAGPGGTGEPGPPGEPGEIGGSLLSAFWQYSNTTTPPPGGGQIRTDSPITTMWIAETDTDGYLRQTALSLVESGSKILLRATNGTRTDLNVLSAPVDNGTYWTFSVSTIAGSGTVTKGTRCQVNFFSEAVGLLPPGGDPGDVLTKLSVDDGDADWVPPETIAAPIRRPTRTETGTTYSPLATDENMMIKLSNAAAITVVMPTNATTAIPVDAEFDYVWWSVGQPTFSAEGGATINGTPGLKLRARYSACTAKKMATNDWLIYGDLSA